MRERLTLFATLTVAPVIALAVSVGSQWKYQAEWEKAIRTEAEDVSEEVLQRFSLASVCADPKLSQHFDEACSTIARLDLVSTAAWIAIGLGLALPVTISLAGAMANQKRRLLASLFAPALYLTNWAVALLVLLHTALIVAAAWYGMTVLAERISVKLALAIAALGLGGVFGAISIFSALRGISKRASTTVVGKALQLKEAPTLWQTVMDLAESAGTDIPSHLVVGLDPTFFVTEADVNCLTGQLTGRTMYLSLPLCRILTQDELRAVVAHELAHFHGADTQYSLRFFPIYRGAVNSYMAAASGAYDEEGNSSWVLLPAVAVLGHFLRSFAAAESKISRERELVADRFAASLVSEHAISSALVKIYAFSGQWAELVSAMHSSLKAGSVTVGDETYDAQLFFSNASRLFAAIAQASADGVPLDNLDEKKVAHPTDSHPPLSVRLESLHSSVAQVAMAAVNVSPEHPAIELLEEPEATEVELSFVQQILLCPELAHQSENGASSLPV